MKKLILFALTIISIWSCKKDDAVLPHEQDNGEVAVSFNLAAEQPTTASRAVDEGAMLHPQMLLIGPAGRYFLMPTANNKELKIKHGIYDIYAIANVQIGLGNFSERNIKNAVADFLPSTPVVPLSYQGKADFTRGERMNYTVNLVRAVAKLSIKVQSVLGVKITSWRLNNISTTASLFATTKLGTASTENTKLEGGKITAYIPESLAGDVPSITDQKQRTAANAPAGAVYLTLFGELSNKTRVEYRIYLGENETTSFNLRRNHGYHINVNILSESTADVRISTYRVEHQTNLKTAPNSDLIMERDGAMLIPSLSATAGKVVNFKYTFMGNTSGLLSINGQKLSDNTFSGALRGGDRRELKLFYEQNHFKWDNYEVGYKVQFSDEGGVISEYSGTLKFANKLQVYVPKDMKWGYRSMGTISTLNGEPVTSWSNPTSDFFEVFYVGDSVWLRANPNAFYKFDYWGEPTTMGHYPTSVTYLIRRYHYFNQIPAYFKS